jgi:arsenite methyltransferase
LKKEAALYAGCISGDVQKEEYLRVIKEAGFTNITVQKDRKVEIPNEILIHYMTLEQLREFKKNHVGIFSVTVYAERPSL